MTPGHAESRDCDRHGDRGDATVAAGIEPSRDLENSVPRPGSGPAAGGSLAALAPAARVNWHLKRPVTGTAALRLAGTVTDTDRQPPAGPRRRQAAVPGSPCCR